MLTNKRILILYISDISGHKNAALAIEKALKYLSKGTEILSLNAFNYTNPLSERIVNYIYMEIIKRTPGIWKYLYDNPNVVKKLEKIRTFIHRINSPKLKKLFDIFRPHVVVCTQAYPAGMVADFKKFYNIDIPLIAVLTDYIPHSYWILDEVNFYISPSEEVSLSLIKKGVSANKIKSYGIPIDPKFTHPLNKLSIIKTLGLNPDLPIILIMGGGQGLGPINKITESLEKSKFNLQLIVVTGSNRKLKNYLDRRIKRYKNKLFVFGYVDNIHELMEISTLIITKPGGITTAEALAKKLPMIIVKPIPGQEESNAKYLIEKGAAIKIEKINQIPKIIDHLLENQNYLEDMCKSIEKIRKPQSSFEIAKLILDLAGENA